MPPAASRSSTASTASGPDGPSVTDLGLAAPVDLLGRPLRDLRVSVTDRCNLRCRYCMPREVFGEDFPFLERDELLTFEEIERLVRALVELGIRKVRLTGGEPLLRRDLPDLVARLTRIEDLDDVALTTNGVLLGRMASALVEAGLRRVTVSLDALDDATFRAVSDTTIPVRTVLDGIAAAQAAGLAPVKVNAVLQRGVNDDQVEALAGWARDTGVTLRFIEFMDVGTTNRWQREGVVPAVEIAERLAARWPIEPVDADHPGEVAERYRYLDGAGEVGIIASVTRPFCGTCSRARLSAIGELYTCLFASEGHDLRGLVRSEADDAALRAAVSGIWRRRDDRASELRAADGLQGPRVEMSYIGG
jgi:cyclic pyranopterin phosphate synthase